MVPKRFIAASLLLGLALAATGCSGDDPASDSRSPSEALPPTVSGAGLAYIALGDSLSAGFGASKPSETSFVPLVLENLGDDHQLINLGHGGDTSADLMDHGHLDGAIETIGERRNDGIENNEVALVTLEIGGNDLLGLYFGAVLTGVCPDVTATLSKSACTEPLATALAEFDANLGETLDQLLEADTSLRILLLTLYNPFPGFLPVQSIAALALEGIAGSQFLEGLNDIIRGHAAQRDIPVVELYEPFENRAGELISGDFIHPNDAGYRVMAEAVIATLEDLQDR